MLQVFEEFGVNPAECEDSDTDSGVPAAGESQAQLTFSTFSDGIVLEGPETVQPPLKIRLPPQQVTTPADSAQGALAPATTGTDPRPDVPVGMIFQRFPKCFILF